MNAAISAPAVGSGRHSCVGEGVRGLGSILPSMARMVCAEV